MELINHMEAFLVRALANDLLNKRKEWLGKASAKRAGRRPSATAA